MREHTTTNRALTTDAQGYASADQMPKSTRRTTWYACEAQHGASNFTVNVCVDMIAMRCPNTNSISNWRQPSGHLEMSRRKIPIQKSEVSQLSALLVEAVERYDHLLTVAETGGLRTEAEFAAISPWAGTSNWRANAPE